MSRTRDRSRRTSTTPRCSPVGSLISEATVLSVSGLPSARTTWASKSVWLRPLATVLAASADRGAGGANTSPIDRPAICERENPVNSSAAWFTETMRLSRSRMITPSCRLESRSSWYARNASSAAANSALV